MRKLIVIAALFIASSAQAEKPNYYIATMKTQSCMVANAKHMRQLNDRSEEAVIHWLIDKCHSDLSEFMETYLRFTVEMRYRRLHKIAVGVLAEYPRGK